MTGGQIMVIAIVAMALIAGLLKARLATAGHRRPEEDAERQKLREDVRVLRERVAVLERIATDRKHHLADEIESLRDR
jgi:uncharacterized protein YlxW (UPF0749 family)